MLCGTIKTRCRICGELLREEACADEIGTVWKEHGGHPLEDGAPWCPSCIGYLNRFCDDLCADVDLGIQESRAPFRSGVPDTSTTE